MLIKESADIKNSEITDKKLYLNRRKFITSIARAIAGFVSPSLFYPSDAWAGQKLAVSKKRAFFIEEKPTSYQDAAAYNNFYEFTTDKLGVADLARNFKTRPWTISVEGLVKKPKVYGIDDLKKMFPLEERIYRFRCVEAWSMVIPWIGFSLGELIKKCEPSPGAQYVEFTTLFDPKQMPGQREGLLQWPYREGLRMDEAMHPLTLLAVGMYGEVLPNQSGAPIRLVVPWKYGFKSIKSIVRIRFTGEMPVTTWSKAIPEEYGFYANVNPRVDHPRWSQARERRIGESGLRETLMFNGYADQVEKLYEGMDLKKFF